MTKLNIQLIELNFRNKTIKTKQETLKKNIKNIIMTKNKARIILHTDVLSVPDTLCGVVELEFKQVTLIRKLSIVLTGRVSHGPDPIYVVPYRETNGKPYYMTNDTTSERRIKNFWQQSIEIGQETHCFGNNMENEYPVGIHYIQFAIPINDFPVSFSDPSLTHSLFYTAHIEIESQLSERIVSPVVYYTIVFNNIPKFNLNCPRQVNLPSNNSVDATVSVSSVAGRIGDTLKVTTTLKNKTSNDLKMYFRFNLHIGKLQPIQLTSYQYPIVEGYGFMSKLLNKDRFQMTNKQFVYDLELPPGLFPSSNDQNMPISYSISIGFNCGGYSDKISIPVFISALKPQRIDIMKQHLNCLPIKILDKTNDFTIPFRNIHILLNKPVKPFQQTIEQVKLKDSSEHFYVDHYNRTTMLSLENQTETPPFSYPHWRNVTLPNEYIMYYFENKWCYINLTNDEITFFDPRPINQRVPFYSQNNQKVTFFVKINSVRGIPFLTDKQPTLSFQINEYKHSSKGIETKVHTIKAQDQSIEPIIPGNGIQLQGVGKRMNVIVKVFQKNIMFDDIYGYINIDFHRIPMGVTIMDWFPIISNDSNAIGCGEANITFGVMIPDTELSPVVCNCESQLMKLYYLRSKNVQNAMKNEEKFGQKMRKGKSYKEFEDYLYYTPVVFNSKIQYLRKLKFN